MHIIFPLPLTYTHAHSPLAGLNFALLLLITLMQQANRSGLW